MRSKLIINIYTIINIVFLFYVIAYLTWKNYMAYNVFPELTVLFRNLSLVFVVVSGAVITIINKKISNSALSKIIYLFMFFIIIKQFLPGVSDATNMVYLLTFPLSVFIMLNYTKIINYNFLHTLFFFLLFCFPFIIGASYLYAPQSLSFEAQFERGTRYTMGFTKPSYFAEYILILFYLVLSSSKYKMIGFKSVFIIISIFLLILSGSRAAMISMVVYFLSLYLIKKRILKYVLSVFVILVVLLFSGGFVSFDYESVNLISSGRVFMWVTEVQHNISNFQQFLFGNINPESVLGFTSAEDGEVYHLDSFFVELFIKNGIIGLLVILGYIYFMFKESCNTSKAIILSISIYGIFEGPIFTLLTLFGLLSMLIIFLTNKEARENSCIEERRCL